MAPQSPLRKPDVAEHPLWRGTWRSGEIYRLHDLVQDKNSLHVCVATETSDRPMMGAGWSQVTR